jgi:hypothetical protein
VAHDVFISYSSKDKLTADAVCARLEARGIRCWIAPRDVRHGANYGASILDAIHASRVVVLVLSAHANTSVHIPNEIERAVSHGLAVVPFRIEEVLPAKSLDLFIGSRHWLDAWTPPLEQHLDQLADSLAALIPELRLQPSPTPIPLPVPTPTPPALLKIGGAVAAVLLLAIVTWLVFGRGGQPTPVTNPTAIADGTLPPAAPGPVPPAPAPAPAPRPAAPVAAVTPASTAIVGCWRWANNATVTIRSNGTMTAGPFDGRWQQGTGRSYVFTWPPPVDTVAMSPDGNQLAGGNQYGVPVAATRVSGGPDLSGVWTWGGVATVVIDPSGTVTLGSLTGSWTGVPAQRLYRVTWEPVRDSVTLSNDNAHIQGVNQYGVGVAGTRLPTCS